MTEYGIATMEINGITVRMQAIQESKRSLQDRGGKKEKAKIDPQQLIDTINLYSGLIIKATEETAKRSEHRLETITMEFGLSASMEGNIIVTKASGEASLKVTITWQMQKMRK